MPQTQGAGASLSGVDQETATFLDRAVHKRADLMKLIKNPRKAAQQMNLPISDNVVRRLKALGAAGERMKMDAVDRQLLGFFNKVIVDGRFINEFGVAPAAVARKLDVTLSKAALQRLKQYKLGEVISVGKAGGTLMSPIAVAVVVAAIIVLWSRDARKIIIDKSGSVKL